MNYFKSLVLFCGTLTMLSGCAGVGVVETSDPAVKLRDAYSLFDRQDRPLVAERLIREAIEIYQKNSDELGLAEAYRTYGFFFESGSVEGKWSKQYREGGFLDKSATFDTRFEKSIEYFEKARAIFAGQKRFGDLTNVNMNLGYVYSTLGKRDAACQSFDRSLENYRDNLRHNPFAKPISPKGFGTFEEFLADLKKKNNCK